MRNAVKRCVEGASAPMPRAVAEWVERLPGSA
jgi:hypothetical protein